jgi:hypothetical protein
MAAGPRPGSGAVTQFSRRCSLSSRGAGTGLERALDALVPQWIAAAWPFTQPRYIGRDLSWADRLTLPPS